MHRSQSLIRVAPLGLALLTTLACGSSQPGEPAMEPPPPPAAAFEIALGADKLAVLQGASATLEVTVVRKDGFAGAVTLSATGLPAGTSLAAATVAAGDTKTSLTIAAEGGAAHSLPTAVKVLGTSGDLVASGPLTVTVYGPPGSLDTSFGGGKVVVPVGASDDYARAAAVQADGKILLAGSVYEHLGDFALVRLERDGAIDTSFGAGGKVMTDLAGGADLAYAVGVQADGKIVLAGSSIVPGSGLDFAMVRYNADGTLDTGFGAGGKVTTSFGPDSDTAYALLIQPDGKIVLGGDSNQGTSATGVDFALARYHADGNLDGGFGTDGKVITSLATGAARDSIYALALQEVGGQPLILAAGGEGDFALARYTSSGALDVGFGGAGQGKVRGLLGSTIGAAQAVAVGADGRIVVAGHHSHDFALVRLTSAGLPDASFGAEGRVLTKVSETNWDEARGVAIERDGKIVVGGWVYEGVGSSGNFALCRYGETGQLDPSFGVSGKVITEVAAPTKADQATAVLLQADPRIPAVRVLVAGYAGGSNNDFAVTRYWR